MRERSYNHSSLVCRRPLVKNCGGGGGYLAPGAPQPELVCETFYETECQPEDSGQVRCEQVQRKICAEENCREEEGEEVCEEELVENTVMVPEETCSLDPETVCRNVTVIYNLLTVKSLQFLTAGESSISDSRGEVPGGTEGSLPGGCGHHQDQSQPGAGQVLHHPAHPGHPGHHGPQSEREDGPGPEASSQSEAPCEPGSTAGPGSTSASVWRNREAERGPRLTTTTAGSSPCSSATTTTATTVCFAHQPTATTALCSDQSATAAAATTTTTTTTTATCPS